MRERIRAVLFDLDGVLIDSFHAWHAVLDQALAERGRPPIPLAEMQAGWGQGIQEDVARYFQGEPLADVAAMYDRLFREHVDRVTPIEGALPLVSTLAERGLLLAVVTNTPRDIADRILTREGFAPHLRALAAGDEVERAKPDPALLHLAAGRLGIDLRQVAFVGDTRVDVEAGRRAPCLTVGYRIAGADARIEALRELIPLLDGGL
jgi:phosphoglycolate phosphatase